MFPLIDKKKTGINICGNRHRIYTGENQAQIRRLCADYDKINEIRAAQNYTTSSMTNKDSSLKIISRTYDRNDLREVFL